MKCPTCRGSGQITRGHVADPPPTNYPCETCGGSGEVPTEEEQPIRCPNCGHLHAADTTCPNCNRHN